MMIQTLLETAIHKLVQEFTQAPYRFFTEADAVAHFHQLLESPTLGQVRTRDGYEVSLVHREYPTFFRFEDDNPVARLDDDSRASRGHYDTVILNPEFVAAHRAETVKNRDIKNMGNESIVPLEAVIEFKLDDKGWSKGRASGTKAELGKLDLTTQSRLKYFVLLMRYNAPNMYRWNEYWPTVSQIAAEKAEIGSIFAIYWLTADRQAEIYHFGHWLDTGLDLKAGAP
jgi:hypothetical protein